MEKPLELYSSSLKFEAFCIFLSEKPQISNRIDISFQNCKIKKETGGNQ